MVDLRDLGGWFFEVPEADWLMTFEEVAFITSSSFRIFGTLRKFAVDCLPLPEEFDLSPLPWLAMRPRARCSS